MNNIELLFAIVGELINVMARHSRGEDISADLDALQIRVKALKSKEERIAAGDETAMDK